MRAASDAAPASDMLGLAVLVALNIADEFFRERDREVHPPHGELHERALRLERIVDEALAQVARRNKPFSASVDPTLGRTIRFPELLLCS